MSDIFDGLAKLSDMFFNGRPAQPVHNQKGLSSQAHPC
jgi:hypothetical protein